MTTKDKIVKATIKLFNQHGLTTVTLRQIAVEIGISHGNLAYHYSNKGVILGEIYTRMDEEMATTVYPSKEKIDLFHFNNLFMRISNFQKKYRFFYMDILEISRHHPEIIQRYRHTIKIRRDQFKLLFNTLIEMELLKPEPEPGYYKTLVHGIWVMSTFWLQQTKILGEHHPSIDSNSEVVHVWKIMLPHLTEKGLEQYRTIEHEY
ncbi:MAG: TetR/AcrR family transcriptional regulator [Bacteroidia bacterium]